MHTLIAIFSVNPFSPASLLISMQNSPYSTPQNKFLVMRINQMIIHSNFSMIKSKILPTCLQGKYQDSLGELSNTSHDIFGAERAKN